GVYSLTKDTIEANQMAANLAAYQEVVPGAENFAYDEAITASLEEAMAGDYYKDGAFGKTKVNEVVVGTDASGNVMGYGLSVTSMEGFDGEITMALGIAADGTVNGISFTVINETAGMGMKADEPDWKAQFAGVNVDSFTLNKSGGSTADNEIDSVSGASITSGAVVNAVNTGLDFYHNYIQ
ncbi:MAG: FMN-binding protein, partial [Firmicutes bacterium]|nr:FMN-binding protein [Bacillota bacterium]